MDDKQYIERLEELLDERKELVEMLIAKNKSLIFELNNLKYAFVQCEERFEELLSDTACSKVGKAVLARENQRLKLKVDKMHRELQILRQKETLTDMLITEREDMKKEIKYLNGIIDGDAHN